MPEHSEPIVLIDLPTKGKPHCFSPNTWKIRAVLNYKGLDYKTDWTDFPDLHAKLISYGIPPNTPEVCFVPYSSPTIRLPDGSWVMESLAIARALEELQPEPSLHLDPGYPPAQTIIDGLLRSICPPIMYRIPDWLLPTRGAAWYHAERKKVFKLSLYELAEHEEFAGEKAWEKAEPFLKDLSDLLRKDPEGPYVRGKQVSYEDFVVVGFFRIARLLDEDGDVFGRLMGYDNIFGELWEACQEWYERDDH